MIKTEQAFIALNTIKSQTIRQQIPKLKDADIIYLRTHPEDIQYLPYKVVINLANLVNQTSDFDKRTRIYFNKNTHKYYKTSQVLDSDIYSHLFEQMEDLFNLTIFRADENADLSNKSYCRFYDFKLEKYLYVVFNNKRNVQNTKTKLAAKFNDIGSDFNSIMSTLANWELISIMPIINLHQDKITVDSLKEKLIYGYNITSPTIITTPYSLASYLTTAQEIAINANRNLDHYMMKHYNAYPIN